MCESCEHIGFQGVDRRHFLKTTGMLGTILGAGSWGALSATSSENESVLPGISKEKARVLIVFMYPPDSVVLEGKFEDRWAQDRWFTYPGNQFQKEMNHRLYRKKVDELSEGLDLSLEEAPVIYTRAGLQEFIRRVKEEKPDALFIFNFCHTLADWSYEIAREANEIGISSVVYQPVGANHQLPRKSLLNAEPGIYYIHSIRNWEQIGHALAAIHAKKYLSQTRLLRAANHKETTKKIDPNLGVEIVYIPGEEFNDIFDSISTTDEIRKAALDFKKRASEVIEVRDEYIVDGFRSYHAVLKLMERYGADMVTIRCLQLKERKPCIGFSLLNSELIPCACEGNLEGAITMLLGSLLFKRGGFMHNPEFDINRNQYYGAHCTCALKMFGPDKPELPFRIRPFTHQLPKTAALDVKMPQGQKAIVTKYLPEQKALFGYTGKIVDNPEMTIAGGCATRFLMDIDKLENVCDMYHGVHPILYLLDPEQAERLKVFAKLSRLEWIGNV